MKIQISALPLLQRFNMFFVEPFRMQQKKKKQQNKFLNFHASHSKESVWTNPKSRVERWGGGLL